MKQSQLIHLRNLAILLTVTILMVSFGWVGYLASDDMLYAVGAQGWMSQFPYVGDTHWSLRHTFVIPLAISFSIFGINEYSLALTTTAYFLAVLVLTYWFLTKEFDHKTGLLAGILITITPLFAVWATIAGADLTELFFVFLSLGLFHLATQNPESFRLFFFAGITAGLAWWTRETALGLLLLYGILFLIGYAVPRRMYWVMAAGFAIPYLSELLYFWTLQGDPLYRLWVDIDQGQSTREASAQIPKAVVPVNANADNWFGISPTGNINLTPLLNPFLALLANDEFGLLFLLAIPASIWAWRSRTLDSSQQSLIKLLIGLGLVWFLTLGYIIGVRELPRYFSVTTLCAIVVLSVWLSRSLVSRKPVYAILIVTALATTNILAIYISNREPVFAEKALTRLIKEEKKTVFTDPHTVGRARFLLKASGLTDLVKNSPPPPGSLFFYNPNSAFQKNISSDDVEKYQPKDNWIVVRQIKPNRKIIGHILEQLRFDHYLSTKVWKKLNSPNQEVTLYRVEKASERLSKLQGL